MGERKTRGELEAELEAARRAMDEVRSERDGLKFECGELARAYDSEKRRLGELTKIMSRHGNPGPLPRADSPGWRKRAVARKGR